MRFIAMKNPFLNVIPRPQPIAMQPKLVQLSCKGWTCEGDLRPSRRLDMKVNSLKLTKSRLLIHVRTRSKSQHPYRHFDSSALENWTQILIKESLGSGFGVESARIQLLNFNSQIRLRGGSPSYLLCRSYEREYHCALSVPRIHSR